jgi:GNAT superfamily N-acetyltransferase
MHPGLIRLRAARPDDRAALDQLHRYAFRASAQGIYDEAVIDDVAERCVPMNPALLASGRYWLIEAGGQPVASAGWSADPPAWIAAQRPELANELPWVRCVHIDPRISGAGLGAKLLQKIEHDVSAAGFQGVNAWVSLMTIPLYRGAGFAGEVPVTLELAPSVRFIGLVMQRRFGQEGRVAA